MTDWIQDLYPTVDGQLEGHRLDTAAGAILLKRETATSWSVDLATTRRAPITTNDVDVAKSIALAWARARLAEMLDALGVTP